MELPLEVMFLIVELAATHTATTLPHSLDPTSDSPCVTGKPDFTVLGKLATTCRWLYTAVRKSWFRILYIRESIDWTNAEKFGICAYVREIRVLSGSLTEATSSTVFLGFPNLHTAFIDAHNDFIPHEPQATSHGRSASFGRYRLLTSRLPSSLRRLWIVNAHGPDAAVIRALCAHCPQIEEIQISRCTMFSPRLKSATENEHLGTCKYWELFPGEHESYFSADGVLKYAESLGQEIKPLSHLRKLHMGLYLTPYEAVEQHRRAHRDTTLSTRLWDAPCRECAVAYGEMTKTAETTASQAIFESSSSLVEISWASFFTEGRTGSSSYDRSNMLEM
ncbi:hypothetical protein FRC12_008340 [Ceratobasidium sp. 428]|nr:hypothetical protein FRC12_008340 [Ceratobasidium sp. 428]